MRRHLAVLGAMVLLLAGTGTGGTARQDLDGNGRVDLADVRILARMAAGLDPANPAFDQNGDGRITMEDVQILSAAADMSETPQSPRTAAPAASTAPVATVPTGGARGTAATPAGPTGAGAGQFLVVRQASDGQIVVVVGAAGIQPGDRILGIYGSLAEATAERDRLLGGAAPRYPAPPARVPAPAPRYPSTRAAAALPAAAGPAARPVPELAGTVTLVPFEPGRALAVLAGRGEGWVVTERGGGRAEVSLRRCDLGELRSLGEPVSDPIPYFDPHGRGDGLFVFLPNRGDARILKGISSGTVRPVRVTLVPTLQGRSGGVAVAGRRGKDGETTAVYLYHWPSGTALYAEGLSKGTGRLKSRPLNHFPVTAARPVIVPVLGRAGATRSFTVLDPASRGIWCVLNVRPRPSNPKPVSTALDLGAMVPSGVAGTLALDAAPLMGEDGRSSDALVVEGRSGRMALLAHHDDPARIRLQVLDRTLDGVLPASDGPRHLLVMTLAEPGTAIVLDGSTGRMARVTVSRGGAVSVEPVRAQ